MRFFAFFFCLIFLGTCTRKIEVLHISSKAQIETFSDSSAKEFCNDALNYVPDSNSFVQIIRVNVHFLDAESGDKNFSLEAGRKYMNYLINNANDRLNRNHKMNLPEGNNTPAIHPKYQYKITASTNDPSDDGFYKHYDDELFYFLNKGKHRNNYDRSVIKKYSINEDSILNIFVLPHHPDSVRSKSYSPTATGIALGTSLKVSGLFERKDKPWVCATLLNHEVGHILGLRHAWLGNDGCEDTPKHRNCWAKTEDPPCNTTVSNNVMDYNNSQMAISPCQIGIVHKGFAKLNSKTRKLLEPLWCELDTSHTLVISDSTVWNGAKDLKHNILIRGGASLEINCRVAMPQSSKIEVEPGGVLVLNDAYLHNSCGEEWLGIFLYKSGNLEAKVRSSIETKIENIGAFNDYSKNN